MFMLDIQGDPKGLSIGGLVVINKSMSLTVKFDVKCLTKSTTSSLGHFLFQNLSCQLGAL